MVQKFIMSLIASLLCVNTAFADSLFEGYYKVLIQEQHVGYIVTRYEFDAVKNQFSSIYFLKTGKGETETTESLKALADSELNPISYEYTSLGPNDKKLIDVKFKNSVMTGTITTNKATKKIKENVPKGTFLSTFLVYLMMKSKDGLKTDTNYSYQAIAEEDAQIVKGQAVVEKEQQYIGNKSLKVLNNFKDLKFISYVNERGEVLGTSSVGLGVATELVASPQEAIGSFSHNPNSLKTLFGNIPDGKNNILAKKLSSPSLPAEGSKQLGIPQGKGIILKAQPQNKTPEGN